MAEGIAKNFVYYGCPLEFDELVQLGLIRALEALPDWEPARGKLSTFLGIRMRGAMQDEMRNVDLVPRLVRQKANRLRRATLAVAVRTGREPTDEELAVELQLDGPAQLDALRREGTIRESCSLADLHHDDTAERPKPLVDKLDDPRAEDPSDRSAALDGFRVLLKGCNEVERLILIGYYAEQQTMKQIGRDLGISESRVSQIHSMLIDRLRIKHADRREELCA